MGDMNKALAGALLLVATLTTTGQAADPWAAWTSQIQTALEKSKIGADKITKMRDARCLPQPTAVSQNTCVLAYDVILARIGVEQAEMKLKVAAVALPAAKRDQIISKILGGYDKLNQETVAMADQIYLLFPPTR